MLKHPHSSTRWRERPQQHRIKTDKELSLAKDSSRTCIFFTIIPHDKSVTAKGSG